MTTLNNLLPPPEPAVIFPSERTTCHNFTSATPELVHHAAIMRVFNPKPSHDPCSTCGKEIDSSQPTAFCSLCHKPVCAACIRQAGYTPDPERRSPDHADDPPPLVWNLDRRDFLIREMKEQAWNVQRGRCGQCHQKLTDIAHSSIMNSPAGPMLLCDDPCAARAMGREDPLPPGSYPTDPIRIVADPRHGLPQDWLNVHFELSLPDQSDEVWSKADCRFGVELYADPERWDFFGECIECRMASYGNGRPHKWCRTDFFLRDKQGNPDSGEGIYNAQMLLDTLGWHPENLPGVYVRAGDPDCLDYWLIPPPICGPAAP